MSSMAASWLLSAAGSVADTASRASAAIANGVTELADGFERERLAMEQKAREDEQALAAALQQKEREDARKMSEAKSKLLMLRLPWIVDGDVDADLRHDVLSLSVDANVLKERMMSCGEQDTNTEADGGDDRMKLNKLLLDQDPNLEAAMKEIVRKPDNESQAAITEEEFWRRYWQCIQSQRESHLLRSELSKIARRSAPADKLITVAPDIRPCLDSDTSNMRESMKADHVNGADTETQTETPNLSSTPVRSPENDSGDDLDILDEGTLGLIPDYIPSGPTKPCNPSDDHLRLEGVDEHVNVMVLESETNLPDGLEDLAISAETLEDGLEDLADLDALDSEVEDLLADDDF